MKRFLFFGLKATIQRAAYNTCSLAVTEGHTNDTFSTFGKKKMNIGYKKPPKCLDYKRNNFRREDNIFRTKNFQKCCM